MSGLVTSPGGRRARGVSVTEFVVELYVARTDIGAAERGARARWAAAELSRLGTSVRYLNSIFVPEDETCFFLYEALSADAVRAAQGRAALPTERISTALASDNRRGTQ